MTKITLKQTVTYKVNFYVDDFESVEEFNKFVDKIKTDDEFMIDHFLENVDRENLNGASDIEVEY